MPGLFQQIARATGTIPLSVGTGAPSSPSALAGLNIDSSGQVYSQESTGQPLILDEDFSAADAQFWVDQFGYANLPVYASRFDALSPTVFTDVFDRGEAAPWTPSGAGSSTLSIVNGQMLVEVSAPFGAARLDYQTTAGKWYVYSMDVDATASTQNVQLLIDSTIASTSVTAGNVGRVFTDPILASDETAIVLIRTSSGSGATSFLADNYRIQEVDALEGWVPKYDGALTINEGRMRVTDTVNVTNARGIRPIPVTIGKHYTLTADLVAANISGAAVYVGVLASGSNGGHLGGETTAPGGSISIPFLATVDTIYPLMFSGQSEDEWVEWENVRVEQVPGLDDWLSGNDVALSLDGDALVATNTADKYGFVYRYFTPVALTWYKVSANFEFIDVAASLRAGTNPGNNDYGQDYNAGTGPTEITFQAPDATPIVISLVIGTETTGLSTRWSDIEIEEIPALDGWDDVSTGTGTIATSAQQLNLIGVDGSNRARAEKAFTVVSGNNYVFSLVVDGGVNVSVWTGSDRTGTELYANQTTSTGTWTGSFVASGTTAYMWFGATTDRLVDDVVVQEALVTNGTFDADSDWTKGTGWTIANGVATHASGTSSNVSQAFAPTVGSTYRVEYEVTAYTAGSCTAGFLGGTTVSGEAAEATGVHVDYLTAVTGNNTFRITSGSAGDLSIDNVIVTELPSYTQTGGNQSNGLNFMDGRLLVNTGGGLKYPTSDGLPVDSTGALLVGLVDSYTDSGMKYTADGYLLYEV